MKYIFAFWTALYFTSSWGAESIKAHKVSGACLPQIKKEKVNCPFDLDDEAAKEVHFYSFPTQESKKVKTMAAPCTASLVAEITALKNAASSDVKDTKINVINNQKLRFDPEVCTVLSTLVDGKRWALLELREFQQASSVIPETFHRQLVFASVDKKGKVEQILKNIISKDTGTKEREMRTLQDICDTDGDGQAEVVLNEEFYESTQIAVLKVKPDLSGVTEKTFLASGGCESLQKKEKKDRNE